jgi:hypothetical protein
MANPAEFARSSLKSSAHSPLLDQHEKTAFALAKEYASSSAFGWQGFPE